MILPIVLSPSWYVKGRAGSCMRPKATVGVCFGRAGGEARRLGERRPPLECTGNRRSAAPMADLIRCAGAAVNDYV